MNVESAKVLVAEDSDDIYDSVESCLRHAGHQVVRRAIYLEDALTALDDADRGELDFDIMVLDANLAGSKGFNGEDAVAIMNKYTALQLGKRVIGFSTGPMSDYGVTVDVDLRKDTGQLPVVINELMAHDPGLPAQIAA